MAKMLDKTKIPKSVWPFVKAIEGKPDYVRRMARLCSDLSHKINVEDLKTLAVDIRKLAPNDQVVLKYTGNVINNALPGWHFGCLDDVARNQAYQKVLNTLVTEDTVVLDAGAGCGVLSLFAAAAGAKHVYAIEIESLAAEAAREIVRLNGFEDRITVIEKDIFKVKLGEDIPEKCNLLVQDIIWPDPFSRNIHNILNHCQRNLLTEDALLCPESIRLISVLSDTDSHIAWPDYGDYFGFDLSPMNILSFRSPEFIRPHNSKSLLTDDFVLADYDLTNLQTMGDQDWETEVTVIRDGYVHFLLQWQEFGFPDGTRLESGPESHSVRALAARRYFDPVQVKKGDKILLKNHLKDGVVETSI